jgi:hypothetical protein
MVKAVLTGAGFVENETFKETRFLKPPNSTYAIYSDSFERRGADGLNLVKDHDYTIELYSDKPDPEAEDRIEASFDALGLAYDKDERTWIQAEQIYQTLYTFNFIEK